MEHEQWINDVFESTVGKTNAIPDAGLFAKIQDRIQAETISMRWVWITAATLLLLVALNMSFAFSKSRNQHSATETIANDLSKSNQLY